jgi:ATP-binding cassette subfamily F protein uup
VYGSVDQWLAAFEQDSRGAGTEAEVKKAKPPGPPPRPPAAKAKKLSFREQQEWDGMEAAILAAEGLVADRQAAVAEVAGAGHVALADACRALEDAQRAVERLYARWQELEGKRGPTP